MVLFMNTILFPNKLMSIKMGMTSLIVKSYKNQARMNWRLVLSKVITKLLVEIYIKRGTPLTPCVIHLYYCAKCLIAKEREEYKDKSALQFFDFKEKPTA